MPGMQSAQLLSVGFNGFSVSAELGELLDRGVGGVILFRRNVETPRQVLALTREIRRRAGRPLLISVDQEGGLVRRFREGFTDVPSMRGLGEVNDPELAFDVGRMLGRELRAVGVNVNFAPVMDVDTNPANPVIGERALSNSPAVVARLGVELIRGMQSEAVAACAKHFPGHGDTQQDSHLELARVEHDPERLNAVELVPFRAAVLAEVASIMTAHVMVDALDSQHPATLSEVIVQQLLRQQLGYDGVVFSDGMEMKAIADRYEPEQAAVLALRAGVDNLLVCHSSELAHAMLDGVERARSTKELPETRCLEAQRRLERLTARVSVGEAPGLEVLGCPAHRALAERFRRATTQRRDVTEPAS